MVEYTLYELKKGQLLGGGGRTKRPPSIFIAYSFQSEESREFRDSIEQQIKKIPSLQNIILKDGHVPVGTKSWSSEIRKRLKSSRLVIAELSVLSPEVLFECGFAWGLNKPLIPVIRSSANSENLPKWLTDIQFGESSTEKGLSDVVNVISTYMQEGATVRQLTNTMMPSPNEVVVISKFDSSETIDKVRQFSSRHDLSFCSPNFIDESLCSTDESITSVISHASLIIGCLSGTKFDNLVHFAAGMVCARPTAGIARKKMRRHVLLLIPENEHSELLIADSARRVTHIVRVAKESELIRSLESFVKLRKQWQTKQETQ